MDSSSQANDISMSEIEKNSASEIEKNFEIELNKAKENSDLDPADWELVEDDYVYLDLVGLIQEDTLVNCDKNQLKLIGLFDENPVLQIGKTYFVGKRKEVSGTNVLFHIEDPVDESSDEENNFPSANRVNRPKLQLRCMTRKKLVMEQAFIRKK